MIHENENVILVDKYDNETGVLDKYTAHKSSILHRAISVFIFNDTNEFLIQKRSESKYHSPSIWANTCCTHPRKGESVKNASLRRVNEEMGVITNLFYFDKLIYESKVGNLYEHEFVHIFTGRYNGVVNYNKQEVSDVQWISINEISRMIENNSDKVCQWLKAYYSILGSDMFYNMIKNI